MTNRVKGLTVALKNDFREDDVDRLVSAIYMFEGVVGVKKSIDNSEDWINRTKVRDRISGKVQKAIWEEIQQ